MTLDAYDAADKMSPIKDKRWVIEHVVDATPEQMDQIKRLGVMVSATYAGYGANVTPTMEAAARARIENQTPTRAYIDKGLVVSAGTDFLTDMTPDDNPFTPIYFNVTRKTRTGQVIGPQHRITREEALRVSTINYAYTTFEETIKGSLEPGKLADFLILSRRHHDRARRRRSCRFDRSPPTSAAGRSLPRRAAASGVAPIASCSGLDRDHER